jgi:hypothetical protein
MITTGIFKDFMANLLTMSLAIEKQKTKFRKLFLIPSTAEYYLIRCIR